MTSEIFSAEAFFWTCLWQSTIFITSGLIGSFIFKHRSARAHQVLLLAMIAAVIVPVLSQLVKHYEIGLFTTEPTVPQSQSEYQATKSDIVTNKITPYGNIENKSNAVEKDLKSAITASESTKFPYRSVMLYGWLAASLILAFRLAVTFILGIRLLGRVKPLKCNRIEQTIHLVKAKLQMNRDIMVYGSDIVRSPVIWCWRRRPALLLPSAAGLSEYKINWVSVLCHELAHYKRRDHVSGLLAELVVCIMPWHPLLWLAKSRLIKLSEQACDDWVIATGQSCTDYAESLLDLTPCSLMALVPTVVSSKKGLAGRIQHILKDSHHNPRTGVVWALTVTITAVCLTLGIALAQTRPNRIKSRGFVESQFRDARIIHFPKDRSMGTVYIRDVESDNWYENWQKLNEATGDIAIPQNKEVKLEIDEEAAKNLSPLNTLRPDDLQMLSFGWKAMKVGSLEPIGNLKGLKALNIQRARFDSDDFKYLTGLNQLQVLRFGDYNLTDESMRYVGQLTSLRSLALWGTGISDEGLKHLQGLTNLTFLALNRCEITDHGLNYLRNMTALEGLQIYQTKITDNGLEKLRGLTRLKHIDLSGNGITDAGLKHIENLTSLENIWINSNPITDKGLSYLAGMKNLKQLYALHTEITYAGLANFKGAKDIRFVVNPKAVPGTAEKIESSRRRIISFPEDRSMGKLFVRDSGQVSWYDGWQESAEAKGNVSVAAGKEVKLQISEQAAGDLSDLDKLGPNDLQMLSFGWKAMKVGSLEPIGNLKGLKALNIQRARFDSDDFKYLTGLDHLQVLRFGDYNLTDESMRYIGQLTSLQSLALWGTGISDEGLKHLRTLTNLTFLALNNCKITDEGLNYLKNMTTLEGLQLTQTKITDKGLAKLKNFIRLKSLLIDYTKITDAGLEHLQTLTSLEIIWINSTPITDKGIAYICNMKNLKSLFASRTKITDAGLAHLNGLRKFKHLNISGIGDGGIQHLSKLPALEKLQILDAEVTQASIPYFKKMGSIKEILLSGDKVDDDLLNALRTALPNRKIWDPQRSRDYPMAEWRQRFEAVYRLEEGQILKRISPPFIPERRDYYLNEYSHQASLVSRSPDRFVFHWDRKLKRWGLGFINTPDIDSTLRGVLGLNTFEYDGPEDLLSLKLPGDWIVRDGTSQETKLKAFEQLLEEELDLHIRFEKRTVEQEVIMATGRFKFHPVPGADRQDVVHLYVDELRTSGGGTAHSVAELLQTIGNRANIYVVDRTEPSEENKIPYYIHSSSRDLRRMKSSPEKTEKLKMFLANLTDQTELQFEIALQPVEIWYVTADKKD